MMIRYPETASRCRTIAQAISMTGAKRVMVICHHGLGDGITVYANCISEIRKVFPDVQFLMDSWHGQEQLFGKVDERFQDYDLVAELELPTSQWDSTSETKAQRSLRTEFGIPDVRQCQDYGVLKRFRSPLVGVHYFSTSGNAISCSQGIARMVWDAIMANGLIPIDTYFAMPQARIERHPYGWQNRTVDGIQPDMQTLFGLLGSLGGFAGVSSGNFWAALGCMEPKRILFIQTEFPVTKLIRLPVWKIKRNGDASQLKGWIDYLKQEREVK